MSASAQAPRGDEPPQEELETLADWAQAETASYFARTTAFQNGARVHGPPATRPKHNGGKGGLTIDEPKTQHAPVNQQKR